MKLKQEFKNLVGLSESTVNVLCVVLEKYGFDFTQSYRNLAKVLEMTHANVRHHFKKLEKYGFLTIDKGNKVKFVFHLNIERVKQLLDE